MPIIKTAGGETVWSDPFASLKLEDDTVHLWRCAENLTADRLGEVAEALNTEERARAQQYRFEPDRRRFVLCRAILRDLVGRYLGCPPRDVEFARGAHGKPELAAKDRGAWQLEFNLSHTRGMCLIGFARDRAIGVDVEAIDPKRDWSMLGRRFLHPGEWEMISSLPMAQQAAAFYTCWTCKEAYVKARGEGLSRGLTSFQVLLPAGLGQIRISDELAENARETSDATEWWLKRLDLGTDWAAAVASPRCPVRCECFQYC
jgi:4'-phosphopantetheinyl transferase